MQRDFHHGLAWNKLRERGHAARILGLSPVRQRSPKAADPARLLSLASPRIVDRRPDGPGTRNALLSLGGTYLEIIAPDPAQSVESQMVTGMAAMSGGGLVTWAAQGDLLGTKALLEEAGISSAAPVETRRRTADGGLLVWGLLFPQGGGYGMPFFIDWRDSPHPAATTPVGGELVSFGISTPDAEELGAALAGLGLDVEVLEGEPEMRVALEGAKGRVTLTSTAESRGLSPSSRR